MTAKVRVLQVIGSMHLGGAENVVVNIARGLDRERFDLAVCCTRELGVLASRLSDQGVEVRLVGPQRRALRHLTPLRLQRLIWQWRPDVVHTHGVPAMLHTGPLSLLGTLPPWVHTFHFGNYGPPRDRDSKMERAFSRRATRLIAVSDAQRAALIRHYDVRPDHIATIHNGVGENPFVNDPTTRTRKRAELGLGADAIVLGCVAVLSEQKGIPYFLQAADTILAHDPRIRIVIVGGGPHEAPLRQQAAALACGERILFTGWRPDSLEILPALDMFVMPSLWEAMPMVLLEAMAARRPIVVTDVGENRAIVQDGRCGVVIPPRNAEAISTAVLSLLAQPDSANEMGARAEVRFREHFTTAHMVAAYERLFAELAPGRR